MCVLCAAPPAAVGPVQQQLQGEEERRAGPAGPGAGRRLQGRRGPRASRKAAGPLHEPVLVFVVSFFFGLLTLACCCRSAAAATRGCGTSRGRSSRDAEPPSPPALTILLLPGGKAVRWTTANHSLASPKDNDLFRSEHQALTRVKGLPTLRAALEGLTGVSFSVEFLDLRRYV